MRKETKILGGEEGHIDGILHYGATDFFTCKNWNGTEGLNESCSQLSDEKRWGNEESRSEFIKGVDGE